MSLERCPPTGRRLRGLKTVASFLVQTERGYQDGTWSAAWGVYYRCTAGRLRASHRVPPALAQPGALGVTARGAQHVVAADATELTAWQLDSSTARQLEDQKAWPRKRAKLVVSRNGAKEV